MENNNKFPANESKINVKTIYVTQLPINLINDICIEVKNTLYEQGYRDGELDLLVDQAMHSRLCDLEDTIDISKYYATSVD